jgi:ubiquinone/menaquinone biosynthesis C-methylase UbiE
MKTPDEMSYFELQAYVGTTKHMGGFATTEALVALCHIDENTRVLDVGCGVGATACHLASAYGCEVVGVDLREAMVELAEERAAKEGVAGAVTFRQADARALPFDDAAFDGLMCESVLTFVEDKATALGEYARVVKPGGYIGLNEEFWLKPPTDAMRHYAKLTWGIETEVLMLDDWMALLGHMPLVDLVVKSYTFDMQRESTQLKRYTWRDMARMLYRTAVLYLKRPAFRTYMRERRPMPKDIFDYFAYAVFVGRRS